MSQQTISVPDRLAAAERRRIVVAGVCALAATAASVLIGDDRLVTSAGVFVAAWWLALLLLLPGGLALVLLAGSLAVAGLLSWVSRTKAELTDLPLMAFDVRLAAAYPTGFLDAMKVSGAGRLALYGAAVLAAAAVIALTGRYVLRAFQRVGEPGREARARWRPQALLALLIVAQAGLFAGRLPGAVERSSYAQDLWEPRQVVLLERQMGTLPFLYYSYVLERSGRGNLIFAADSPAPPDRDRIASAAARVLRPVPRAAGELPNIVLMMMESTFDVNAAFRLAAPVRSAIYESDGALAHGPLRVNAVGGGSWISEFESITGVDARLFGFSGYYTHAAVSPYVRGSLVTWLRERGYRTAAYYPVTGAFYNARRAYLRYGFDRFVDSRDLGFPPWVAPDSLIAAHYVAHLQPVDRPFFAFFVLTENHGPHRCRSYTSLEELPVRFSDPAEFGPSCELNEYTRVLTSTERALLLTEGRLRTIEEQTGRPYLLVAYGDHQPHTFTGTGDYAHDFGPHRRPAPVNRTLYRITGSVPNPITAPLEELPLTLLPTLISGFVADGAHDLYLGVNLLLWQACGADALAGPWPACAVALEQAIAAYHGAGIFRLLPGEGTRPNRSR